MMSDLMSTARASAERLNLSPHYFSSASEEKMEWLLKYSTKEDGDTLYDCHVRMIQDYKVKLQLVDDVVNYTKDSTDKTYEKMLRDTETIDSKYTLHSAVKMVETNVKDTDNIPMSHIRKISTIYHMLVVFFEDIHEKMDKYYE